MFCSTHFGQWDPCSGQELKYHRAARHLFAGGHDARDGRNGHTVQFARRRAADSSGWRAAGNTLGGLAATVIAVMDG